MYKIGLFSNITKTTIKTLRYYDNIGLLKPKYISEDNGYRYYTADQLTEFYEIVSYRQAGLSINEIKDIVINNKNIEDILESKKKEKKNIQKHIQNQILQIDYLLKEKKEGFFMEYKAIIKDLPECIVYSKKLVLKDYNSYFELIPAIGEEVSKANPKLKCTNPEYCFIVCLEDQYKEKDNKIEFCEAVDSFGTEVGDIKFKKIDSVKAVCIIHKGSYKNFNRAYSYGFKWIEENGYEIADRPRENYIDGIWNKENEEDWITEIQFPIREK